MTSAGTSQWKHMFLKFYFINWTVTLTIVCFWILVRSHQELQNIVLHNFCCWTFWPINIFRSIAYSFISFISFAYTHRKKCCLTLGCAVLKQWIIHPTWNSSWISSPSEIEIKIGRQLQFAENSNPIQFITWQYLTIFFFTFLAF